MFKQLVSLLCLCVMVVSGCANRGNLRVERAGEGGWIAAS